MTADEFNNWRERFEQSQKTQQNMIKAILEKCDKEMLIQILKKRKIISQDWSAKGTKWEVKECQRCQLCEVHKRW